MAIDSYILISQWENVKCCRGNTGRNSCFTVDVVFIIYTKKVQKDVVNPFRGRSRKCPPLREGRHTSPKWKYRITNSWRTTINAGSCRRINYMTTSEGGYLRSAVKTTININSLHPWQTVHTRRNYTCRNSVSSKSGVIGGVVQWPVRRLNLGEGSFMWRNIK